MATKATSRCASFHSAKEVLIVACTIVVAGNDGGNFDFQIIRPWPSTMSWSASRSTNPQLMPVVEDSKDPLLKANWSIPMPVSHCLSGLEYYRSFPVSVLRMSAAQSKPFARQKLGYGPRKGASIHATTTHAISSIKHKHRTVGARSPLTGGNPILDRARLQV